MSILGESVWEGCLPGRSSSLEEMEIHPFSLNWLTFAGPGSRLEDESPARDRGPLLCGLRPRGALRSLRPTRAALPAVG